MVIWNYNSFKFAEKLNEVLPIASSLKHSITEKSKSTHFELFYMCVSTLLFLFSAKTRISSQEKLL